MARKNSATNRTKTEHGYILVWMPEHPRSDIRGYIYEHRLVAETKVGRPLLSTEQVHHIDGNKENNSPDNLEVCESHAIHRYRHRTTVGLRMPDEDNPIIYCECGCGTPINKYDALGRPRKYISGHNSRIR